MREQFDVTAHPAFRTTYTLDDGADLPVAGGEEGEDAVRLTGVVTAQDHRIGAVEAIGRHGGCPVARVWRERSVGGQVLGTKGVGKEV